MRKKDTVHIRIKNDDKKKWNEYCKLMGESSPRLFNKVLNSSELNLNQRILTELKKKEERLKRGFR